MTAKSPITAPIFTFQRCEIFQSFHEAPEVEIYFVLNGQKSRTSLSAKDVLSYLQRAGKYTHEGFCVDMDGVYYVKEYQESDSQQGIVKINLESKIKSLSTVQWGYILAESFRYTTPNYFHLFKV